MIEFGGAIACTVGEGGLRLGHFFVEELDTGKNLVSKRVKRRVLGCRFNANEVEL